MIEIGKKYTFYMRGMDRRGKIIREIETSTQILYDILVEITTGRFEIVRVARANINTLS